MKIALYQSAETFLTDSVVIGAKAEIKHYASQFSFNKIERGTYAIAIFHDENDNNLLDKNFLGIPLEDYAFSNNATALIGPPSFESAKFSIETDTLTIHIRLN